MTVARVSLVAGIMISLPVVIWAAGIWAEADQFYGFAPHMLSPGLKAILAAQVIVLTVFVPWFSFRFSWDEIIVSLMVFILVPLPLLCLSWLMNVVSVVVVERGIFLLVIEAALILVISKVVFHIVPSLFTRMIAGAGMQALFATAAFALRGHWLAWIGL
jgi:hypothetical protein